MTPNLTKEPTTPTEFKQARHELGLTVRELAHILGVNEDRVRKYELEPASASTAQRPNPTACRALGWMLGGWRPPEWPRRLNPFCGHGEA